MKKLILFALLLSLSSCGTRNLQNTYHLNRSNDGTYTYIAKIGLDSGSLILYRYLYGNYKEQEEHKKYTLGNYDANYGGQDILYDYGDYAVLIYSQLLYE